MANSNWASGGKIYSMHVQPVMITASITIGAAGAVSSFVGSGVASATRTSAGLYKIVLQPGMNFSRLFFANASIQKPSGSVSGIGQIEVQNAPNTSVALAAAAELSITCLAATAAGNTALVATDPVSGSVLNILMIASNSSVTIGGE